MVAEIERLVVRMANEHQRWGYCRIQGALSNLGYHIHSTTVCHILRRNHIDPAPIRGKAGISWSLFIKFHWEVLDVSGFFEARLSKMAHLLASLPQLARELSTWGSQLLGWVFDHTLGVLTHVAQKCHTLGSRYYLDKQTFIRRKARDNLDNADGTRVYWSRHAITEMVQDQLTRSVVETALQDCEVIEDDPAAHRPLPDCLVLEYLKGMHPIHAVIAID